MKRYFGVIVIIAGVLLAAVMSYRSASAKAKDAQRDADSQRIQAEYLERVGWMRTNPNEATYKEELKPFFRAYFEQVDTHLTQFGGNKKFDGYLEELEKRSESGKEERANDRRPSTSTRARCSTACARAATARCGRPRTRACAWTSCRRTSSW